MLATVITPLGPPAVLLLEGLATWSSALGALPGSAGPKDKWACSEVATHDILNGFQGAEPRGAVKEPTGHLVSEILQGI